MPQGQLFLDTNWFSKFLVPGDFSLPLTPPSLDQLYIYKNQKCFTFYPTFVAGGMGLIYVSLGDFLEI